MSQAHCQMSTTKCYSLKVVLRMKLKQDFAQTSHHRQNFDQNPSALAPLQRPELCSSQTNLHPSTRTCSEQEQLQKVHQERESVHRQSLQIHSVRVPEHQTNRWEPKRGQSLLQTLKAREFVAQRLSPVVVVATPD